MISLLLPSRGRPEAVGALYRSLVATTDSGDEWEMVVRLDHDDPTQEAYPAEDRILYLIGPRALLSACWNECYAHAEGPVFMHAGDDIVFRTEGWYRTVLEAFPDDGIAFVHGHDGGPNGVLLGTHGFLRREWVDAVGYFVPPLFSSDYNDTWLNAVATVLDRRVFRSFLTEHMHPAHDKGIWDQTHLDRIARHEADQVDALYASAECARLRVMDAAKLAAVMQ